MEKSHHQIRHRILSCSRVSENYREPGVPETEVSAVERLDGLARMALEELAITHFVKDGTLQNACSQDQEWLSVWRKVLIRHRQVDEQPTKRSKSKNDKSAGAMLKKGNWQERESVTDECHDRTEKLGKRSDKKMGQNSSKRHLMHGNWVAYFRTCAAEVYSPERHRYAEANPTCKIHKGFGTSHQNFNTKILRSDIFVQVNLMSVAPTLQNLGIGL